MMICVDCLDERPDEEEAADLVFEGLSLCVTHMDVRKARRNTASMTGPEYVAAEEMGKGWDYLNEVMRRARRDAAEGEI